MLTKTEQEIVDRVAAVLTAPPRYARPFLDPARLEQFKIQVEAYKAMVEAYTAQADVFCGVARDL